MTRSDITASLARYDAERAELPVRATLPAYEELRWLLGQADALAEALYGSLNGGLGASELGERALRDYRDS